jgi:isoleucyl-tRNA synthetase
VQQLRKEAGLAITDRIHLVVDAPEPLRSAVDTWRDYIAGETLATVLDLAPVPAELARDEGEIEGTAVAIGLVRA